MRTIERFFNKIKQCRRVATRYDKLAANYLAFVKLASIRIWLRANESTPQKSISRQLGSRPFKNYLSNCGIVAIGLTVDARAMGSASSTMIVSGAARDVRSGSYKMRIYSLAL